MRTRIILALVIFMGLPGVVSHASTSDATTVYLFSQQADFVKIFPHYDLSDPAQIEPLREAIETEISRYKQEEQLIKEAKAASAPIPTFQNHADKGIDETLKKMLSIVGPDSSSGLEISQDQDRDNRIHLLAEMGWSLSSNFMVPVPPVGEISKIAWQLIVGGPLVSPPVCQGRAVNRLEEALPSISSSYWNSPGAELSVMSTKDVFNGFNRTSVPRIEDELCAFKSKDKIDSYGTHAKISADCGPYKSVKIKFGKFSSEAFGSRMYWLMGYNVYPNDHADYVRMTFTPEIFEHFNDRKNAKVTIIPGLMSENTQYPWDPFDYIDQVEMKDGSVYGVHEPAGHTLEDLKKILFVKNKKIDGLSPALVKGNLTEVQNQIQNLVFGQADISMDENEDTADWTSIGGWDWSGQGHSGVPELRMAGIFLAWLDAFDARWDNNDLRISKGKGPLALQHVIKDTGGVLGGFKNMSSVLHSRDEVVKISGEDPNDFAWEFTKKMRLDADGHPSMVPLNGNFHTIQLAGAIADCSMEDALKMASLMKRIQPEQVKAALIGAGFPSAKVRMFMDKLANRRNHMFQDLGLADVAPWPLEDEDQKFNYDPLGEIAPGSPESVTVGGRTYTADDNDGSMKNAYDWVVYHGKVMQRSQVKSSSN